MLMNTKLSGVMIYFEKLPLIKSDDPSVTCSCGITWQTKTIISPLLQPLWQPNFAGWWLSVMWISLIKSHDSPISWCCESNAKLNHYISTTAMLMNTKTGRVVTCHEGLLPIKLYDPVWRAWSCKILWQTKNANKCLNVRERVEVVKWNKRWSPPFPCCPVSRQCPWKKILTEKKINK